MNLPILALIAGGVVLALQSKKPVASSYVKSGIIYTCDSLQIKNAKIFDSFVKAHVEEYHTKYKDKLAEFNLTGYFAAFIKKLNTNCYTKFLDRELKTKNEKIILLAFWDILINGMIARIDNSVKTSESYIQFIEIIQKGEESFNEFIGGTEGITIPEVQTLISAFQKTGSKFP